MNFILCDGDWTAGPDGSIACAGTLSVVSQSDLGLTAMTIEDARELSGHTMWLFAVVFGVLVARKALSL